ncbi:MAG: hypothetical protein ACXV5D_09860 [Halobacteriota archaeon]
MNGSRDSTNQPLQNSLPAILPLKSSSVVRQPMEYDGSTASAASEVKRLVEIKPISVGRADDYTATRSRITLQVIEHGARVVHVLEDVLGGHEFIAVVEH